MDMTNDEIVRAADRQCAEAPSHPLGERSVGNDEIVRIARIGNELDRSPGNVELGERYEAELAKLTTRDQFLVLQILKLFAGQPPAAMFVSGGPHHGEVW